MSQRASAWALAAGLLLLQDAAGAEEPAASEALPPVAAPEVEPSRPPGWLQPAPRVQLEMDPELIPINRGAVFVPAMSEGSAEPPYVVLDQSGVVQGRAPMGKKAIVPPGRYQVMVGSGVESQMLAHDLEVTEGHASLVEADWAGLLIRVVDERGQQFRGAYEVFALPAGESYGLGLGADETLGETPRTWLLPPGRYLIVRSGETVQARSDFLTVRLTPGELVHFTLVQNAEGRFVGGGEVDRFEGSTEIKNWLFGLVLGGDLLWNRNDNVPGRAFGNTIAFNAFVLGSVRYMTPDHIFYTRMEVDGGASAQEGQDLRKTLDELDLDAHYTYRLLSWLGPYVRFGLNANLFPGHRYFDQDETPRVLVFDEELNQVADLVRPSELKLADSFDPLELKEGVGLAFDFSPSVLLDLHLRIGLGSRQTVVQSLRIERKSFPGRPDVALACEDALCFAAAESSVLVGGEATLIGSARLFNWFMIDTEFDMLEPFYSTEGSHMPVFNWKTTFSLRLVSFASLAYVVRLDYNEQLSEFLQFEQRILLRFSFDIL
ncbi:MAG TPA: hypothetical protein PK668_22115 [Myxococcota bacterium]|nr:hypothetical protein [Myxococcota bacterium]HRY96328.1 hypothetical protein [Myxococcota bacterium]